MICFQISIFEPLKTTAHGEIKKMIVLWFAFKLVSLNHWKQLVAVVPEPWVVVICFQISIFEPLKTTISAGAIHYYALWFAFKLVSLNHWKQLVGRTSLIVLVVICFQISIFEPLKTTLNMFHIHTLTLWFAFKLVSLNHWKQLNAGTKGVQISCDLLSN